MNFFSKCDQIRWKLRMWSHLLKESLMENFIVCAVKVVTYGDDLHIKSTHIHKNSKDWLTIYKNQKWYLMNLRNIYNRASVRKEVMTFR